MKRLLISAALAAVAMPAAAEITLYGREDFEGRSFSTEQPVRNLESANFANRASSAIVRGGRYDCADPLCGEQQDVRFRQDYGRVRGALPRGNMTTGGGWASTPCLKTGAQRR